MQKRSRVPSLILLAALGLSWGPMLSARALPEAYASALRTAGIASGASSVVVLPLDAGGLSASANADVPMNPASAMKLLTTYAALQMLGPAYTWRTEVAQLGTRDGNVVLGDLAIRGSGDPALVVEQLWLLVQRVRALGIREIRGDVVLDKTRFVKLDHDPGAFDGDALRTYNVGADALLANYKAIAFTFVPDVAAGLVRVVVLPPVAGLRVPSTVRGSAGACGDWHARLDADFSRPFAPVFRGSFPYACGERTWNLSTFDHTTFFGAVFRSLWEASGGVWTGKVREGSVAADAVPLAIHDSPLLAEVIRDVNKFSNNVMAQQVFLTLGAEITKQPGSYGNAQSAIRAWLDRRGLTMPDLVLEHGTGLSRVERITAEGLARVLADAYASPVMPEFMSSLPIVGVDGTTRNRRAASGRAHIKTGYLGDVRAIAGYVLAESGRRYVIVALINDPRARAGQRVHDTLLEWVHAEG